MSAQRLLALGLTILGLHAARLQAQEQVRQRLVEINTTEGRMVVALYNETPAHRDRFLQLVQAQGYDSTLFHRVVPGFMVQGGDPDSRQADDRSKPLGSGGQTDPIPAEIDPRFIHRKGALAAARQPDEVNPEKRDGVQFYLVHGRTYRRSDLERLLERRRAATTDSIPDYTPEQIDTYWNLGGAPHLDGAYTIFGEVVEGLEVLDAISSLPCDGLDRPLTDVRLWMTLLP